MNSIRTVDSTRGLQPAKRHRQEHERVREIAADMLCGLRGSKVVTRVV